MSKIKKILITAGSVIGVLVLLFFCLRIKQVTVTGSEIYDAKEIESYAMSERFSYNSIYFFVKSHLTKVKCLPFTQEIDVEWKSPTSVVLHAYDKTISGCVEYMSKYVYFDKDGVVLQSLDEHMKGVTIVEGVDFGRFSVGEKLDVKEDGLFDEIMNLSSLIDHYEVRVDKLVFEGKAVTLKSKGVSVFLGEKDFYDDDIAVLSSVLKTTRKEKLQGTIDMSNYRSGDKIIFKKSKKRHK